MDGIRVKRWCLLVRLYSRLCKRPDSHRWDPEYLPESNSVLLFCHRRFILSLHLFSLLLLPWRLTKAQSAAPWCKESEQGVAEKRHLSAVIAGRNRTEASSHACPQMGQRQIQPEATTASWSSGFLPRKMFWDKIHVCMCLYVIPASALMGLVVVAQVWGSISSLACPVPLLHHLTWHIHTVQWTIPPPVGLSYLVSTDSVALDTIDGNPSKSGWDIQPVFTGPAKKHTQSLI